VRLYAGDGHAQDNLGAGHVIVNWFLPASLAVSPGGGDIATTMAAQSVNRYGKDRIGYEFTTAPVIRSFTPARAAAGGRVTITGANFADATAVTFDGVAASSFTADSPTDITATVPPTAGVGAIGVTTPKGRGWSSGSFRPEPSITSFAPAVGIAGTRVTIAGTNLLGTSAVEFGGVPATSFSVSSATRVTAVVPATATDGELTLVTPGGSASSSTSFRPEPAISLLSPRRDIARARVVIEGTNLSEASSVRFAGRSAHFVVTSPTSIVARVPKLARGGHVVVQSPTGRAVSLQRFQPEPSINSVEPHRVRPGAWLRIVGGNLAGTFRVRVDGRRARLHVVTPTLVVVTVPPRARHGRITVWTWGGIRTARIVVRAKPRR
jgi:hypothetical protein